MMFNNSNRYKVLLLLEFIYIFCTKVLVTEEEKLLKDKLISHLEKAVKIKSWILF